jgi:hypothetical protein
MAQQRWWKQMLDKVDAGEIDEYTEQIYDPRITRIGGNMDTDEFDPALTKNLPPGAQVFYMCVYVCMYAHVYVYIYMHMYIHTYNIRKYIILSLSLSHTHTQHTHSLSHRYSMQSHTYRLTNTAFQ